MRHDTLDADAQPTLEAVYLVGARLHPGAEGEQLYTLLLMDEEARDGKDRPLTDADGYIVWFSEPALAERALALGDAGFRGHAPAPVEPAARYDFAELFWRLTREPRDTGAVVLNGLNLLLDLVEATAFPVPSEYRRTLFALADHLTFAPDFGDLLDESGRGQAMDAITWCIGAVAIKSRVLASEGPAPPAPSQRPG